MNMPLASLMITNILKNIEEKEYSNGDLKF